MTGAFDFPEPTEEEIRLFGFPTKEQMHNYSSICKYKTDAEFQAALPTKDKLLANIQPGMRLTWNFFKQIYGYEITYPGFTDVAIRALEDAGCSRAREYYEQFTTEYEKEYHDKLIEVSEWYQKKLDDDWERKVRQHERKEVSKLRKQEILQNLTENELTELCKKLLQEGIITSPEQFVMVLEELDQ